MANINDAVRRGAAGAAASARSTVAAGAERAASRATRAAAQTSDFRKKDDKKEKLEQIRQAYSAMPIEQRRQYAQKVQQALGQDAARFSDEYDRMIGSYNARSGKNGYVSAKDAADFASGIESQASSLQRRADKYGTLMDIFGEDMDEGFRRQYARMVGSTAIGIAQMRNGARQRQDFYSQFRDEADYNAYMITEPIGRIRGAAEDRKTRAEIDGGGKGSMLHTGSSGQLHGGSAGHIAPEDWSPEEQARHRATAKQMQDDAQADVFDANMRLRYGTLGNPFNVFSDKEEREALREERDRAREDRTAADRYAEYAFSEYNAARDELNEAERALRIQREAVTDPAYRENLRAAEDRVAKARAAFEAQGGDPDANVLDAAARGVAGMYLDTVGYFQELNRPGNEINFGPVSIGGGGEWMTPERFAALEEQEKAAYEKEHGEGTWKPKYLRTQELAGRLAEKSTEESESMKAGRSALAGAAIDIGIQGGQMAIDKAAGYILPGGPLTSMAIRSFGGAVREARNEGADLAQQGVYGLGTAAVEVITEKLFDGVALFYGKGQADKLVSHWVGKIADNPASRAFLKWTIDTIGEGAEEVIADYAEAALKSVYNDKSARENMRELDIGDELYNFAIGAAMGGIGGSVKVVSEATGISVDEESRFFMEAGSRGISFAEALNAWEKVSRPAEIDAGETRGTENAAAEARDLISRPGADAFPVRGEGQTPGIAEGTRAAEDAAYMQRRGGASPAPALEDGQGKSRPYGEDAAARGVEDAAPYVGKKENASPEGETETVGPSVQQGGRGTARADIDARVSEDTTPAASAVDAQEALASAAEGRKDAEVMEQAYHAGQDVGAYTEAWSFAADVLGEHTQMDVAEARQNFPSKMEVLSDAQLDLALTVGRKAQAARAQTVEEQEQAHLANRQRAAEIRKTAEPAKIRDMTKGSVSLSGGKVNGRTFKGVDENTLSGKQRRIVNMSQRLADAFGYHFTFFDGDPDEGGCYIGNGQILVNARAGVLSAKTLGAAVISHEMTHSFKDGAGKQYDALKDHIVAHILKKSPAEFEADVRAQMELEPEISYSAAVDELVANACMTMVRDSEAVRELVRENMSLAERVAETIGELAEKFRAAFSDVDIRDDYKVYQSARSIDDAYDEIKALWDDCLRAYKENTEAERITGKKISAGEGGRQYQKLFTPADINSLRSIRQSHPNLDRVSIFDFTSNDIQKAEKWARQFYSEMGTKSPFFRLWFGDWREQDQHGVRCLDMKNNTVNKKSRVVYNKDISKDGKRGVPINLGEDFFEDSIHYAKRHNDEKAVMKLLANIDDVVENAVLLDTRLSDLDSANKKGSTQFMHILYAPIEYNGAPFLAKITVEEYREDGILRAYNAQRIKMSALPRSHFQQLHNAASAGNARLQADEIMVSQLFDLVKQHDRDFKARPSVDPALLNKDGTPKVFYHGTASDFWAFDMKKATDKTGRLLGLGAGKGKIYLTEYEASARMAAEGAKARTKNGQERVLPLYVSAEKVMDRGDYKTILEKNYEKYENSRPGTANYDYQQRDKAIAETDKEVRRMGYDAVYDESSGEMFVFKNTQVKSATDNIGTFDKSNPDIRYQKLGISETAEEQQARKDSFAALKAENRILRARAEYWKGQTQQTRERTVRQQDTDRLANELLRKFDSRADKNTVKEKIKELGDWLVQSDGDSLSYDELHDRARAIAEEIVDGNYTLIDDSQKENLERLKDYLKSTPVKLSAADFRDTGDENFRRRYGRYFSLSENGRTIDSLWGEMAGMFGEGLFPEDTYAPGDMLNMIADYLDLWKPQYGNVFEANWNEAVDAAAGEIVDRVLGEEIRQTPATYADKAQQKLNAQIAKDKEKLDALRGAKNERIEQIKRQTTEKAAKIRLAEKAAKYEAVSKVKEHYQDMMQRQSEKRTETAGQRKYRAQVAEKAARLEKMLLTNSDKLHVPEALKKPLAEFLSSIDFSSKSHLKNGTTTRADLKFQAALTALADVLTKQERYLNGEENAEDTLGGYLDISQEGMDFLRETTEEIHRMMQTGESYTVNAMSAEQLQGLSKLLSNISSAIRNMNSFMANERYATVKEAAEADIRHMESLGSASDIEQSGIVSALAWENGTPFYVLKRFGEGGRAVFDSFARGWEKMAFNVQKVIEFTEKTYTDKEVKTWKREIHDFTLDDGTQIRMTTAQIMALSQLLGREQAVKHITKGGMRIGSIKEKVGKAVDTRHHHLSAEDIARIVGSLTPRQMAVAKALQRFMARQGAMWGNEVSMRRFGYNFYDEGESYFPIRTDSNDRGMQDTEAMQNSMFRLLNLSASKSLNPKASNALIVEDIFDVFSDHMADMAKLNGMGLPVLDAIKWFNYKERIDLGDGEYDTRTLQGAMEQAFGEQAQRYFRTLMKDINGVSEAGDRGTGIMSGLISNYKAAAVAANLRVAFLQPTSYVRAAAIIRPKYLAFAFASRNAYKEALANSGTAVWKSLGYYDTNISRGMREQIEHNDSWRDKVVEASMSLAELGDKLTWGRLWVACKMQAKAENGSLEGQSLIKAAGDLFREVIYATQVMDSTLTRSELMRGKTLYTKAMTAFMAEPTLSYNLLMDAVSDYRLDVRKNGKAGAWRRNSGKIGTAFGVYAASAAFAAVVESVADAFRDDDNDEFWQKFLEALLGEGATARIRGEKTTESLLKSLLSGNLVQDLTIIGKLPYVKSAMSTLQGYKNKDMSSAAFDTIFEAFRIWQESARLANGKLDKPTKVTYYGNMTPWGKIYKTLQGLSQLSGIGAANLTRDVLAIWNSTVGEIRPDWKIKTYQSKAERTYLEEVYPHGVSWGAYQSAVAAMDADENGSVKQDEAGPYLRAELEAGRLTEEQAEAIWSAATSGKKSLADWLEKNS